MTTVQHKLPSPQVSDDEVDEVNEQADTEVPAEIRPESLDDFLRDMHETSSVEGAVDIPTIQQLKGWFKTKSAAIRYLHSKGHSVNTIHKHLGLRYQHVRNVLTNELKRGPNENFNPKDLDNTKNIDKF